MLVASSTGIVFRLLLISSVMSLSGDQPVGFCYITAKPGEGPPSVTDIKSGVQRSPHCESLNRTAAWTINTMWHWIKFQALWGGDGGAKAAETWWRMQSVSPRKSFLPVDAARSLQSFFYCVCIYLFCVLMSSKDKRKGGEACSDLHAHLLITPKPKMEPKMTKKNPPKKRALWAHAAAELRIIWKWHLSCHQWLSQFGLAVPSQREWELRR